MPSESDLHPDLRLAAPIIRDHAPRFGGEERRALLALAQFAEGLEIRRGPEGGFSMVLLDMPLRLDGAHVGYVSITVQVEDAQADDGKSISSVITANMPTLYDTQHGEPRIIIEVPK